jgi:hypothetical protein
MPSRLLADKGMISADLSKVLAAGGTDLADFIHGIVPDTKYIDIITNTTVLSPCWLDRVSDRICQA